MTNSLIEKVARAICRSESSHSVDEGSLNDAVNDCWKDFMPEAEAATAAVLDYFGDQANMTLRMMDAFAFHDGGKTIDDFARGFAAAMKAAKEELK